MTYLYIERKNPQSVYEYFNINQRNETENSDQLFLKKSEIIYSKLIMDIK